MNLPEDLKLMSNMGNVVTERGIMFVLYGEVPLQIDAEVPACLLEQA